MGVNKVKRVVDNTVVDDLETDELIAIYTVEYQGLTMENFGIAMVALLTAILMSASGISL